MPRLSYTLSIPARSLLEAIRSYFEKKYYLAPSDSAIFAAVVLYCEKEMWDIQIEQAYEIKDDIDSLLHELAAPTVSLEPNRTSHFSVSDEVSRLFDQCFVRINDYMLAHEHVRRCIKSNFAVTITLIVYASHLMHTKGGMP